MSDVDSLRFQCPGCGSRNVRISNSRGRKDNIRTRRYICADCNARFSTAEVIIGESLRGREINVSMGYEVVKKTLGSLSDWQLVRELARRLMRGKDRRRTRQEKE